MELWGAELEGLLPRIKTLGDPSEITYKRLIGKGSFGSVYLDEYGSGREWVH